MAGRSAGAVIQPGAAVGQSTYCPVSGVVFPVAVTSPQDAVRGVPVYFCCAGCAAYFKTRAGDVLSRRGVPEQVPTPSKG